MIFNHSLETLNRINELIKDAQEARVHRDVNGFKSNLLELYKEISPFMCDDPLHDIHKLDSINSKMALHMKDCTLKIAGNKWNEINDILIGHDGDSIVYDSKLWDLLDSFDFFLKRLLKRYGLSYIKGHDPNDAVMDF